MRVHLYSNALDEKSYQNKKQHIENAMNELWLSSLTAVRKVSGADRALANDLPRQINNMRSAYDAQTQAKFFHPPQIIWIVLFILVSLGSFLAGYKMGLSQRRERFLEITFATIMSGVVYLTLSFEFPALGHISLDPYNNQFSTLRDSIKY